MTEREAEKEAKSRWGPEAFAIAGMLCEVSGPDHFGCGPTFEAAFEDAAKYKHATARDN